MSLIPKPSLQISALGTYSLCRKESILDLQHAFHSRFTLAFVNINCGSGAAAQGGEPPLPLQAMARHLTLKNIQRGIFCFVVPSPGPCPAHCHPGSPASLGHPRSARHSRHHTWPPWHLIAQQGTAQKVLRLSLGLST